MPYARAPLLALLLLVLPAATGWLVWQAGWHAALRQVARAGEADLAQASDRLTAELGGFRELAVLLADHPQVTALMLPAAGEDVLSELLVLQAGRLLRAMADRTGAAAFWAFDATGRPVAGSDPVPTGPVPTLWQGAVERALDGALGQASGTDPLSGRRSHVVAAPVFARADAAPGGALMAVVDLEAVEAEWRADPTAVLFRNGAGEVLVSNRSELLSGDGTTAVLDRARRLRRGGETLWVITAGGPYLPHLALHLERALPKIGLTAEVLVDAAPAQKLALLEALLAAAGTFMVMAAGSWLAGRRAALAAANRVLEARVAERTAALAAAQDRLVQAGKLSALGQMSAGISHELNQPLMAICSFAENAQLLQARGQDEKVAQNLERIGELARRMDRIIRNLRAFARQEQAPVRPVDPVAAIGEVLDLVAARLAAEAVRLDWQPPDRPLRVLAGEVRLSQIVLNLVGNALDAMTGAAAPVLVLRVTAAADMVRLTVADTGPGLVAPDRIFDPFFTTKSVGPEGGMGLGLSISYGLVQSFGGAIEGVNRPGGGAEFTVTLRRAAEETSA